MAVSSVPRRPSLASQAAEQLRTQITNGDWPVGTRIPTETELVEQLGVARNTVREAVRSLAHNGLLEIRQGSGTYVRATSELAGVMARRFATAKLQDVNDLRVSLEAAAARMAAERRTASDLRRLESALARREHAWQRGDVDTFAEHDATFHLTVVAAAHSELVTELYADLRGVVRDFIRSDLGPVTDPEKYVDHGQLVEAIRAKDPERAAHEAAEHPHSWATQLAYPTPPAPKPKRAL